MENSLQPVGQQASQQQPSEGSQQFASHNFNNTNNVGINKTACQQREMPGVQQVSLGFDVASTSSTNASTVCLFCMNLISPIESLCNNIISKSFHNLKISLRN